MEFLKAIVLSAALVLGASVSKAENIHLIQPDLSPKQIVPIYDGKGTYMGGMTRMAPGLYLGAAHVLERLSVNELNALLKSFGGEPATQYSVYQFAENGAFIDVVILAKAALYKNVPISNPNGILWTLKSFAGDVLASTEYLIHHLAFLDGHLLRQVSRGPLSTAIDLTNLYLADVDQSLVSWGTSGSVVYTAADNGAWLGVVQCLLRPNSAEENLYFRPKNYFRAISNYRLLSADLISLSAEQFLINKVTNYELGACDPVGGKDGGG